MADVLAAASPSGTEWSVELLDAGTGEVLFDHRSRRLLRTASVAKLFLLLEVAERLDRGELSAMQPLRRDAVAPVADSGLWQHLAVDELPLEDVARLVGAVSDNWATNVLVDLVGLAAVQERARRSAPGGSTLHDLVRDVRTPADPPTLSSGCAADWAGLFAALHRRDAGGATVSGRVLDWLAPSADLSMVASAFGLDPLAHVDPDRGVTLWNKTGTSAGVRADVGLVTTERAARAYAVICNWDPTDDSLRGPVLTAMRDLGAAIRHGLDLAPAI